MGNQISWDYVGNTFSSITRICPIHPNILNCDPVKNASSQRFVTMMMSGGGSVPAASSLGFNKSG